MAGARAGDAAAFEEIGLELKDRKTGITVLSPFDKLRTNGWGRVPYPRHGAQSMVIIVL